MAQMTEITQKSSQSRSRCFCVAPMMEWTDRHCRYFHRLLTRRALLYTEMLTTARGAARRPGAAAGL